MQPVQLSTHLQATSSRTALPQLMQKCAARWEAPAAGEGSRLLSLQVISHEEVCVEAAIKAAC